VESLKNDVLTLEKQVTEAEKALAAEQAAATGEPHAPASSPGLHPCLPACLPARLLRLTRVVHGGRAGLQGHGSIAAELSIWPAHDARR
jgi:hypothetical protein